MKARSKYAIRMPQEHLMQFVLDIQPDNMRNESVQRRLQTLDDMIAFAQEETARENDKRLAMSQDARQTEVLRSKHEAITGAVSNGEADAIINQLKGMMAAVGQGRPPRSGSRTSSGRSTPTFSISCIFPWPSPLWQRKQRTYTVP